MRGAGSALAADQPARSRILTKRMSSPRPASSASSRNSGASWVQATASGPSSAQRGIEALDFGAAQMAANIGLLAGAERLGDAPGIDAHAALAIAQENPVTGNTHFAPHPLHRIGYLSSLQPIAAAMLQPFHHEINHARGNR